MDNRLLAFMGIARRAGKLTMGNDSVKDSMENGDSKLILIASDLSAKTIKNIEFAAKDFGVKAFKLGESMDEIGAAIGKRTGIVSINDRGFAKKIELLIIDD